jgi:hypothetical protein
MEAGAEISRRLFLRPGRADMSEENICGGDKRPVQRRRIRKDGWTEKRKKTFLEHLAATSNVKASAAAAGMNPYGVYKLRLRDKEFREHWDVALDHGYTRIEAMLLERASRPCPPPPIDGGQFQAETEGMDTALALTLLKQRQSRQQQGPARGASRPGKASIEEVREDILKRLSALNKRLGGEG